MKFYYLFVCLHRNYFYVVPLNDTMHIFQRTEFQSSAYELPVLFYGEGQDSTCIIPARR